MPFLLLLIVGIFTFLSSLLVPSFSAAQSVECLSPDPTPKEFKQMIERLPAIEAFANSPQRQLVQQVPVYYNVIRSSDGITLPVTNTDADLSISYLNNTYSSAGLHFYRVGDVNYLDFDAFVPWPTTLEWVKEQYGYVKTALNVYVIFYLKAGFANQPSTQLFAPFESNCAFVSSLAPVFNTNYDYVSHEVGHTLGLLHTFGANQVYKYPPTSNQIDHPTLGTKPRELAIRPSGVLNGPYSTNGPFTSPNCGAAGDLCCDTPADCNDNANSFPAFNPMGSPATQDCSIPNVCAIGCPSLSCGGGQYKDYNADLVTGAYNNIMSYHNCNNFLSVCQSNTASESYAQYWTTQYKNIMVNLQDNVEFMGTSAPMKAVVMQWHHPNDAAEYCNSMSNFTGNFQAILYDPLVTAKVWKLGRGTKDVQNVGIGAGSHKQDIYTLEDWKEGVKACDLLKIKQYILAIPGVTLDGYQKIAADATHSNSITSADIIALRNLILNDIVLPAFSAPWRFIPEYIPNDYAVQFNQNPFNMTINGQSAAGTPYTEPTWQYQITDGHNGKSGYDGIHIGDIDECVNFCESTPTLNFAPVILQAGQQYQITIYGTRFSNVSALQLGLFVDHDKLDVLDVGRAALTDFTKADNVGLDHLIDNKLRVLWLKEDAQPQTIANGNELFSIQIKAKENMTDINSAIYLDDAVLQNAIYKTIDCVEKVELQGITTQFSGRLDERSKSENLSESPEKYATTSLICYPNPFSGQLTIAFENPVNESGELIFTNVNGQVIYRTFIQVKQGINDLTIDADKFNQMEQGLLIVTLKSNMASRNTRILKF